jgi:hypothetical protein
VCVLLLIEEIEASCLTISFDLMFFMFWLDR